MNKRGWFIPILIVSVNALAIALQWAFLPESLLPTLTLMEMHVGKCPVVPYFCTL